MPNCIAIIGSTTYPRSDLVDAYVARLNDEAVIVSGGAPGVDSFAEKAAQAYGYALCEAT